MSTHDKATSPQWAYLDGELRKRGLTTDDLVRRAGVARSEITAWRNGQPASVPTARAIATFLGVSTLDILVEAGGTTGQEAQRRPIEGLDPTALTEDELLLELAQCLRSRRQLSSLAPHSLPAAATGDNDNGHGGLDADPT
ncbi:helix-turn-helix transcriptional regulator [Saccharothrix variisporea]|uniref:DNA-binding XRE family transcriptional regulator n=1 Tax=Saccharothrix variisporea TaxID=543527 RepID=A0A495XD27_9PSEU|nr:helix-turn-helix transcriptional regulator [Saccharothrix variisporea]RKT69438.1 DNA-binding XRE family transcriptional regulator [Saccharothrix variisporea]